MSDLCNKKTGKTARVGRLVGRVAGFLPAAHYAAFGGVGAIVAMAPDASANPIQSAAANLAIPATVSGIYINVVTGVSGTSVAAVPGWDLNPWGTSTLSWFSPSPTASAGVMKFPGDGTNSAGSQTPGTIVDGSGVFASPPSQFGASPGQWQADAINYIGFRFLDEVDGLVHYGWASVFVGANATDPAREMIDIWYESGANTGIAVGATTSASAVPEPSTAWLLGAGAAGLLAFRRRRQQSR